MIIKSYERVENQLYNVSKCRHLYFFDGYSEMSAYQARLFHCYLALINPLLEQDDREVELNFNWIFKRFEMKENGRNKHMICQAVSDFKNNNLWTYKGKDIFEDFIDTDDVSDEEDNKTIHISCGEVLKVFDIMEVKKNELGIDVVCIKCSDEFSKFIFPKNNFVQYDFENIKNLKSIRCITLYEMLKTQLDLLNKRDKNGKSLSQKKFNTYTFPSELLLSTIIKYLQLKEKCLSYKTINHNILQPCIRKINEYTDITVNEDNIKPISADRKVYKIQFIVENKNNQNVLSENASKLKDKTDTPKIEKSEPETNSNISSNISFDDESMPYYDDYDFDAIYSSRM